jgi:hypothetical protein
MSNVYTLETLRADLDKQFAPLQLDLGNGVLTLRNLMRIDESERKAVLEAIDSIQDGDDDDEKTAEQLEQTSAALNTVFQIVTADGKGQTLVDQIDGDLMLSMKVLELWTEATQPGEAQNSPA